MNDTSMAIEHAKPERYSAALIQGDLSRLTVEEKLSYYASLCQSLGLNPLAKPFEYLRLNNREVLYATKACTEQLRQRDQVSLTIVARELVEGVYVVTARATLPSGRTDESTGAVALERLQGEARANAMMKAETKAKRRVTLSICGLGMLDESEVDSIPGVQRAPAQVSAAPRAHEALASPVAAPGADESGVSPAHDPETGEVPLTSLEIHSGVLVHCETMQAWQAACAAIARDTALTPKEKKSLRDLAKSIAERIKQTGGKTP